MSDYTIAVSNTFEAESIEDALRQMVAWISENAYAAGYRISWEFKVDGVWHETSVFVDAERVFGGDIYG